MPFDVKALRNAHKQFVTQQLTKTRLGLERFGRAVQTEVLFDQSFGGSKLRRTIKFRVRRQKNNLGIRFWSTSPHGLYLEEGTKPHIIRARNARFLRFYSKRENKVMFRKKVNHPGNRAYWFLKSAILNQGENLQGFIQNA